MPPKSWHTPVAPSATPALGTKAKATTPSVAVNPAAQQRVEAIVIKELSANNLLGLSDTDIRGAAKQLATCSTKKEVFEWCNTFMLEETLAAEVIKQRDDHGPYFEGSGPRVAAAAVSLRTLEKSSRASRVRKGGPSDTNSGPQLIEGQYFECGCFALSHAFRGNCHNCGRIFCAQESLANCYHCGLDPTSCLAYEIKVQSGRVDEAAQQKNAAGYAVALEKRDQLLKFAKEKAKRTSVIDDQSGVFLDTQNAWSTSAERNAAADAAAAERRKQVVSLHKASGAYTVHLDIVNENVALGARVEDISKGKQQLVQPLPQEVVDDASDTESDGPVTAIRVAAHPALQQQFWFVDDAAQAERRYGKGNQPSATTEVKEVVGRRILESTRLQNEYFEEDKDYYNQQAALVSSSSAANDTEELEGEHIYGGKIEFFVPKVANLITGSSVLATAAVEPTASRELLQQFEQPPANGVTKAMRQKDDGMCLSMHQPWASLLVAGIKTHEGRTWSSEHRGKLWIHAASAKPTDIAATEAKYAPFCKKGTSFPQFYPTGTLLGYVYVTDCLDHDAYLSTFTESERQEDSPFKFICAEPTVLPMPLPMDGKHKIFKLDRKVLLAAKQQLHER